MRHGKRKHWVIRFEKGHHVYNSIEMGPIYYKIEKKIIFPAKNLKAILKYFISDVNNRIHFGVKIHALQLVDFLENT